MEEKNENGQTQKTKEGFLKYLEEKLPETENKKKVCASKFLIMNECLCNIYYDRIRRH